MQSQVRFNRVLEKVLFWRRFRRRFWEALVQSQVSLGGFGAEPGQVQQDLRPFNTRRPGRGVSSAWLRSMFRKICKNKTLRLLGIPPKLFFYTSPYQFHWLRSPLLLGTSQVKSQIFRTPAGAPCPRTWRRLSSGRRRSQTPPGRTVICDGSRLTLGTGRGGTQG